MDLGHWHREPGGVLWLGDGLGGDTRILPCLRDVASENPGPVYQKQNLRSLIISGCTGSIVSSGGYSAGVVFGTGWGPLGQLGENVPRCHDPPAGVSTTRARTHDVGGNGGNTDSASSLGLRLTGGGGSVVQTLLDPLFPLHHLGYQVRPRLGKREIHINAHMWDGTSCPPPPSRASKIKRLPVEFLVSNFRIRMRKNAPREARVRHSRCVPLERVVIVVPERTSIGNFSGFSWHGK